MVDDTEYFIQNIKFNQFTTLDTIRVKRLYKRCSEKNRAIPNKTSKTYRLFLLSLKTSLKVSRYKNSPALFLCYLVLDMYLDIALNSCWSSENFTCICIFHGPIETLLNLIAHSLFHLFSFVEAT